MKCTMKQSVHKRVRKPAGLFKFRQGCLSSGSQGHHSRSGHLLRYARLMHNATLQLLRAGTCCCSVLCVKVVCGGNCCCAAATTCHTLLPCQVPVSSCSVECTADAAAVNQALCWGCISNPYHLSAASRISWLTPAASLPITIASCCGNCSSMHKIKHRSQ